MTEINIYNHCPVCKRETQAENRNNPELEYFFRCDVCGTFIATDEYLLSRLNQVRNISLSGVARLNSELKNPLKITSNNAGEFEKQAPSSIETKVLYLLKSLARKSVYPGCDVTIRPIVDFSLVFANNATEMICILKFMKERGYFDRLLVTKETAQLRLSVPAWIVIEESSKPNLESDQGFVVMWFDPSLDVIFNEAIEPAIDKAGYKPLRISGKQHNDKIDDQIVAEIRRSRFLVADFTGHRGGVYYEAGLAKGLGLDVIWTCRYDEFDKIHFDTRQFNHIVWTDADQLKESLYFRILATIGKGPNAS